uniref:Uncharacterized protein n=1 Tax=viral metagenome TaxID=1070528 RepID=A0A6H1ZPL7_9ZZZZ
MKKPNPPSNFEEVENFVREKGLCVDPKWFWSAFGVNDWHDTKGNPVLNWKMKLYNLDKLQRSWGQVHKCKVSKCENPGVYDAGRDRDGHPLYLCIDHKPGWKPALPVELLEPLKTVPEEPKVNFNNVRNKQMNDLYGETNE